MKSASLWRLWRLAYPVGLALLLAGCALVPPTPAPDKVRQPAPPGPAPAATGLSPLPTAAGSFVSATGVAAATAPAVGTPAPPFLPAAGYPPTGRLAYVRGEQVYLELVDSSLPQVLPGRGLSGLSWSPSGQYLLTGALLGNLRFNSPVEVYRADETLARSYNLMELSNGAFWAPAHAFPDPAGGRPATDWLVYATRNGALRADPFPKGSSLQVLPTGSLGVGGQGIATLSAEGLLAWSENGDAFEASGPAPQVLHVRAAAASGAGRSLTLGDPAHPTFYQLLEWAPGTHLILASRGVATRSAAMPLVVIDADSGQITDLGLSARLTPESHAWQPGHPGVLALADGGGQYLFDTMRLTIVNVANGRHQVFTPENVAAFEPSWSPDGKLLAYAALPVSTRNVFGNTLEAALNGRAIYVLDPAGGSSRKVTEPGAAMDGWPQWTPHGGPLLYARRQGGHTYLRTVLADGSNGWTIDSGLPDRACAQEGCRWGEILAYLPVLPTAPVSAVALGGAGTPAPGPIDWGATADAAAAAAASWTPGPTWTPYPAATPWPGIRVFGGPGGGGNHGTGSTDGNTVVWSDAQDNIHAQRLSDGYRYPVITLPAAHALRQPVVSGDFVAWIESDPGPDCPPACKSHVEARNLSTGAVLPLAHTHDAEGAAGLAGDWLVWLAGDYVPVPRGPNDPPGTGPVQRVVTTTIMARNLRTMAPALVIRQTTMAVNVKAVDGDRVIWTEVANPTNMPGDVNLLLQQIGTGQTRVLAQGRQVSPGMFDLSGDWLTYTDQAQDAIWLVNLRTGARQQIDNAIASTTDGRYVFWVDRQQAQTSPKDRIDLLGYDTQTGKTLSLARDAGVNNYPLARRGFLLWFHVDPRPGSQSALYGEQVVR